MSARPSSQSRNAQACQRCRSLKSKCVPSHQRETCQRCLTTGRDCIWPDTRNGVRKPRGPSRISQVEKKIDGLVAHIANKHSPSGQHTTSDHIHTDLDVPSTAQQIEPYSRVTSNEIDRARIDDASCPVKSRQMQKLADMHSFEPDQEPDQDHLTCDESRSEDESLVTKLLADTRAQPLLEQYRQMAHYFPFVPVDPDMTAQMMSKKTPTLLIVMMAVASWKDRETQVQLEKQYKQELALRTIIVPRKDLALLQSMLIYLAWYHYFIDPKLQNAALLQMCVGLIAELKLDPDHMPRMLPGRNVTKRVRYGKNGQRALLGCYYLCSSNASGLRTSNIFKMSRHMLQCVRSFECDRDLASDSLLAMIVDCRYLDDRIFDFHHAGGFGCDKPAREQLLTQLGVWEASLVELKARAKSSSGILPLMSSIHATSLELYDSLFHSLRIQNATPQVASPADMRINILSSCLESGRSFLDTLVSVPMEEIALIPSTIWMPLPRVLITLAMLTAPSEHHLPKWDVKAARDRVRLDLFLESLCFRMQSLAAFSPPSSTRLDWWSAMKMVLQSVMKWYKRISNRDQDHLVASHSTGESWSPWSGSLPLSQPAESHGSSATPSHSCSANSFMRTPESANGYHSTQLDNPSAFQPAFSSIACPMMGSMNSGFDIDQFMDIGFWGDLDESFQPLNFDFPT